MTRLEGVGDYKQVKNHTSPTPSNLLKHAQALPGGGFLAGGEVWFGLFIKRLVVS